MPGQQKELPTIVPWISFQEFNWVQSSLFSDDNDSIREAYERVLVWQARLGTKTPIAIECTINLIEAKLADNGQLKENHLAKLFSLALVRSISLITHSMQSGGALTPMQVLARQSGIPEYIVQFRHDTSHSVGSPSFSLAKAGVYFMISWLKDNFWDVYVPQPVSTMEEPLDYNAEDDIRDLLITFQQQQFQNHSKKLKKTLKQLTDRLKTEDARNTLCSTLVQDGFLVPTSEQLAALGISEISPSEDSSSEVPSLDDRILQFWHSVVTIVASNKKIPHLVVALVTRLSRISDCKQTITGDVILGWIKAICGAVFQSEESNVSYFSSVEISRNISLTSWYPAFIACVAEVNSYTQAALKILLQTAGRNLPDSTKEDLVQLFSLLPDSLDSSMSEDEVEVNEDLHGNSDCLDTLQEETSFNDSDVRHLRGQHCQAWCRASESVQWGSYPIGMLPGQSNDPAYFNLLCKNVGTMGDKNDASSDERRLQEEEGGDAFWKPVAASDRSHQYEETGSRCTSLKLEASLTVENITFL